MAQQVKGVNCGGFNNQRPRYGVAGLTDACRSPNLFSGNH